LENLDDDDDDDVDISMGWERIKENVYASAAVSLHYCDLKQNKLWFEEEC
jgi:hypothetical protein